MNQQRMMDQVTAVFGLFMTVFYIGVGLYLMINSKNFNLDKTLLNIVGVAFIIIGTFRGFRTFQKLREAFFNNKRDNNFGEEN
jgi:hypothetical protein